MNPATTNHVQSMFKEQWDMARRRGKQKGTLKKEGPSWMGYWNEEVRGVDGQPRWHKFSKKICDGSEPDPTTKRMRLVTRAQAQQRFDEMILSKLAMSSSNPQSLATVREFVEQKFEPMLVLKKRNGQLHYRSVLHNHILPAIGDTKLRSVRFDQIQDLILQKSAQGYSSATVFHIRNTITTIFRRAKRSGWFNGDVPTEGLEMPELTYKERVALSKEQVILLLNALPFIPMAMVLILVRTSLRIGELAGLRWKRVNLDAEPLTVDGESIPGFSISVQESYIFAYSKYLAPNMQGGAYQSVKSKSNRKVPLHPEAVLILRKIKETSAFTGPNDPVFVNAQGLPLRPASPMHHVIKPTLKRLKLPMIAWHDFRHTANTLADQAGMTATERQRILGHADSKMTTLYTHADLDRVREGMARIGTFLPPADDRLLPKTPEEELEGMPVSGGTQ